MFLPIVWTERGIRLSMRNENGITKIHCIGGYILEVKPEIDKSLFLPIQKLLKNESCDIGNTEKILMKFFGLKK